MTGFSEKDVLTGDITLERIRETPRTKKKGFVHLADRGDGSWIKIPVVGVQGAEKGPLLLVDACHHGDESEGTEAILRVFEQLDASTLKGTLVGIPALNLEAFFLGQRTFATAEDEPRIDMNRGYGESTRNSVVGALCEAYVSRFVRHVDALVTLHGGGNHLFLTPLVNCRTPDSEMGRKSYAMAGAFGTKYRWATPGASFDGVLDARAQELAIPIICPEIGGQCIRHEHRDESVALIASGIHNVLAHLGMAEAREKRETPAQTDVLVTYPRNTHGGILRHHRRPEERVPEGELLATVHDIFGQAVEEIRAPFAGMTLGYRVTPVVQPGCWTHLFAKVL